MMDTQILLSNIGVTAVISEITEEISEIHDEERYGRERYFRDDIEIPEEISEITQVVESLNVSIDIMDVRKGKPPTIHQIPVHMRKGNESAYTPTQFSIGPYHRHEDKLLFLNGKTNGIKISYLNDLLKRNPTHNKLENYASKVKSREEEARDCYHDRCEGFQSKDFVEMMVLDGCFIVELFLKFWEQRINESWILIGGNKRDLAHDLMLMENQIPFFILKLILDSSQYGVLEGNPGMLDLALYGLYILECSAGKYITKDRLEEDGKNIYHLLHLNYLCHMVEIDPKREADPNQGSSLELERVKFVFYWVGYVFLWPIKYFLLLFFYALIFFLKFIKLATKVTRRKPNFHNCRKVREQTAPKVVPTATELKECGVIFKRKRNAKNYMDVSFENGIMEIPLVYIVDNTNSAFRNFLALEYFCPNLKYHFTIYVIFLDRLIDTAGDVSFLKNRKIIENHLGCDEVVAKLFNEMTDGLVWYYDDHYLLDLFKGVHVYRMKVHHRWRAMMMRNYFSSPWSIMSLLGALTLLAFTATQVYYAIKVG